MLLGLLFLSWFSSHSRIFHSYGDITISVEGLPILIYAQHLWHLSPVRVLLRTTPTVTRDIPYNLQGPATLKPITVRLGVELSLSVFTTKVCRGMDSSTQPSACGAIFLNNCATAADGTFVILVLKGVNTLCSFNLEHRNDASHYFTDSYKKICKGGRYKVIFEHLIEPHIVSHLECLSTSRGYLVCTSSSIFSSTSDLFSLPIISKWRICYDYQLFYNFTCDVALIFSTKLFCTSTSHNEWEILEWDERNKQSIIFPFANRLS